MCSACGGAGHIAKDCKGNIFANQITYKFFIDFDNLFIELGKRPGQGGPPSANSQAKIDEEYLSLMAELGEGPPPSKGKDDDKPANR